MVAIRTTVPTALPACAQCTRDRRQFVALAISGWVGALAVNVVAIAFASNAVFVLGLVTILAALLFNFAGDYFRAAGTVSRDRAWVTLEGVDDSFAAAINNAVRPGAPVPATIGAPAPPVAYLGTPDILPGR